MKPVVRKRISAFYPQGFIDSNNAYYIVTEDDIAYSLEREVRMILVSLKRVVFFNVNGISIILDNLKRARERSSIITIGFCDYNQMQYDTIRRFFDKKIDFSLYKSFKIASLFTTPSIGGESILVWNENYEQRNLQSIELFERGYNPIVVHQKSDFLEKLGHEGQFDDIVQDTFIGSVGMVPFARVNGSSIIYTLTGYLDATIDNQFDYAYHNKAIRTGFKLFIFDMKNIVSMNIKVVSFFKKIVTDAKQYEGNICIVNLVDSETTKKIKGELEKNEVKFFATLEEIINNKKLVAQLGGILKDENKANKSVTKKLINHLPSFINATVSTLEMMIGVDAVKTGAIKLQDLTIENGNKKLASSIGFYGDMEGVIILVFPFQLAKKSCSIMLGEDINTLSEVLDSLAELVNVIGGRVKTHLAESEVSISITLPRTYSSINDLSEAFTINRGIQVNLDFSGEIFTFFLTR